MELHYVDLASLSLSIPTVPHDMSLKKLKGMFEELGIYTFLTVLKDGLPVGVVYRDQVRKASNDSLTAGDITHPLSKLRNTSLSRDGLLGMLELFPLEKEPVILTDKRGTYVGILTYDVVLHYITQTKEYFLPVTQRLHSLIGKEEHLCVFGLKNLEGFREFFGSSKVESLQKILLEDLKDLFQKEVFGIPEKGEVWVITSHPPSEEGVRELFEEFHREYSLLFGEYENVYIYGFCLDMSIVDSQERLYSLKDDLRDRAKRINGSVFITYGPKPTLLLYHPTERRLIISTKERILTDFKEIVERLRHSKKEMWEQVLYDMFESYPYFELFYIINEKGLQITNNIVNPKVEYFVAQGKKGSDRSDKPYFRKAVEEGSYLSEIYLSKATNDFCITVSQLFSYEGKRYILAGDINFKQIHNLVRNQREPVR